MKHLTLVTLTALATLSLFACGGSGDMDDAKIDHGTMDTKIDPGTMDENKIDPVKSTRDTGRTTGVIFSINPDGKGVTIDHEEIAGVGMGAMTMGFGISSAVDLSAFAKDDQVSFMVKKEGESSYFITAICNTATDGTDCLDAQMKQSKAPTDYKAMFGADYKRGDIGHSTGVVEITDNGASSITIAHGMIHGIDRQASTTTFPIPDNVALEDIDEGDRVEFLVKKEGDNTYSMFKICEIQESSEKCL